MRVAGAHAALRAQGLGQERCSRARARLAAAAAAAASAAMTTAAPSSAAPATPPAAPSWAELQAGVLAAGWTPPDLEAGPTSPYSLLRTFGQPGEPRVVLYRDSAAWCP